MALDTKAKRGSALLEGMITPSGSVNARERATITWIYGGNAFPSTGGITVQAEKINLGQQKPPLTGTSVGWGF